MGLVGGCGGARISLPGVQDQSKRCLCGSNLPIEKLWTDGLVGGRPVLLNELGGGFQFHANRLKLVRMQRWSAFRGDNHREDY